MITASRKKSDGRRRARPHRVLVVIDEECASHALCAAIRRNAAREPVEVLVIAPAHGSPATQWYVDEEAARADATHRLRGCVACLTGDGIRTEARLADPDPVLAIRDALRDFAADEIHLVTAPQRPSGWLRPNVVERVRSSFRQPVKHVVVSHAHEDAPL
jgi:hypothetical protein